VQFLENIKLRHARVNIAITLLKGLSFNHKLSKRLIYA